MKEREPCRVLLWGTDSAVQSRVRRALSRAPFYSYQVQTVSRPREAFAALAGDQVDVVVLDRLSRLTQLRAHRPDVPVIVLVGPREVAAAGKMLDRGAVQPLLVSRIGPTDLALAIQGVRRAAAREAELVHSRDLAQQAARSRAEFLADMSHEIRTPLHAIIGHTELLGETHLDAEQKEYAGTVQASAEVLLGLVNDILDISRIDAGRLQPERIDFYLPAVVETAVEMSALAAHRKGLELTTFFPPRLPTLVRGDPVRLRQVLVNLVSNAVKFTHGGEIDATVIVRREDEQSALIEFSVRDTGIGIPAAKIPTLFQSFTQLDSSSSRKYGGSGLGLAISRRLVEVMGGEIGVESTEGKGSRFWFTLPFGKQRVSDQYSAVGADFFGGLPVLVVDDNETARTILVRYLQSWGCLAEQAVSGPAALELLRSRAGRAEAFRLALVDLRMEGMDGWQLASEISADKTINSTSLVLLAPAGFGAEEARMKLLRWFNGYLVKPVRKARLLETVFTVTSGTFDLEPVAAEDTPEEILPSGPARILVADDEASSRELFRAVMEKGGYTVETVENGREAVDRAREGTFDVAFLDVNMPLVGGPEASRALREAGVRTPIIGITASIRTEERELCLDSGMNAFLAKPFRRAELAAILRTWLPVARAVQSPEPSEPEPAATRVADSEILDFPAAVSAFMGREELVRGLIKGFLKHLGTRVPDMRAALARGDAEAIRFEAHAVKGTALNLRANRLAESASALERAGRDRRMEEAAKILDQVAAATAELSAHVDAGFSLARSPGSGDGASSSNP